MYLLFDADQTIWNFNETERISLSLLFSSLGLDDTKETRDAYEEGNLWCWDAFEKGVITLEELETMRMALFFRNLGRNEDDAPSAAERYARFLSENAVMLSGAEEMLRSLSDYPKALVTNGLARVQRGRIKDTGIDKYFTHIFISQEMGVHKPMKEFFETVLATIGEDKDNCIVIGDSEKSDIQGAVNSGIRSIYYSPSGKISPKATWSVSSYSEMVALIKSLG
ncbi:MAG: YjjG family noncanonical pyrimidine nucleotidase [Candidatus Ornithospirochaeta sp.]